jgi:hypothetical protein
MKNNTGAEEEGTRKEKAEQSRCLSPRRAISRRRPLPFHSSGGRKSIAGIAIGSALRAALLLFLLVCPRVRASNGPLAQPRRWPMGRSPPSAAGTGAVSHGGRRSGEPWRLGGGGTETVEARLGSASHHPRACCYRARRRATWSGRGRGGVWPRGERRRW